MGLISLKCPECHGDLQFDESKETGFCEYCGAKIMLKDETVNINVVHTDGQQNNYMSLADDAFSNSNYPEAYNYYTKVLECDSTCRKATLFKGISAAYMSTLENPRVAEAVNAFTKICGEDIANEEKTDIFCTLSSFTESAFANLCKHEKGYIFTGPDTAKNHFDILERIITLAMLLTDFADDRLLQSSVGLEAIKRKYIETALDFCDYALKSVVYLVGYKNVKDRDGIIRQEAVNEKLGATNAKETKEYIAKLKEAYNNLPSTVAQIKTFDSEIMLRKEKIEEFERGLAAYFTEHPEDEKKYRHPGLFGAKKKRAEIETRFPAELIAKKTASELAEGELETINKSKKSFTKANLK